nr:uncharacterized protein LOC111511340 [Leptinotarsa decemlineata]
MKILLNILLTLSVVLCEVPPPYPARGFRPSPQFFIPPPSQPQTQYGPPLDVNPVKVIVRPHNLAQRQRPQSQAELDFLNNLRIVNNQLEVTYGVPSKQELPSSQYGPPYNNKQVSNPAGNKFQNNIAANQPQVIYGPPNRIEQSRPTDNRFQSNIVANQPQVTYGAPNRVEQSQPQVTYGPPNRIEQPRPTDNRFQSSIVPNQPQVTYGAPNREQSQPQVTYGPPNKIEQPRPTDNRFQSNIVPNQPQVTYGAPNRVEQSQPQVTYGPPNRIEQPRPTDNRFQSNLVANQPQITYGAPNRIEEPQSQYGIPDSKDIETFERTRQVETQLQKINELNNIPAIQYLPVREATSFKTSNLNENSAQHLPVRPSTDFRNEVLKPSQQYLPIKAATNFGNSFQQSQYTSTTENSDINDRYLPPQTYNSPQEKNPGKVTFLNNFDVTPYQVPKESGQSFQNNFPTTKENRESVPNNAEAPSQANLPSQYSPQRPAAPNFDITQVKVKSWSKGVSGNNNKLEPGLTSTNENSDQSGFVGDSVTDRYLPPSTTPKTVVRRPSHPTVAPIPTTTPQEPEETTPFNDQSDSPNVAIATAVAGLPGDQQFYLLQPDGRLQRVLYQKTREAGDQNYEYTANYHFQNIQADPNVVYSPLINFG